MPREAPRKTQVGLLAEDRLFDTDAAIREWIGSLSDGPRQSAQFECAAEYAISPRPASGCTVPAGNGLIAELVAPIGMEHVDLGSHLIPNYRCGVRAIKPLASDKTNLIGCVLIHFKAVIF